MVEETVANQEAMELFRLLPPRIPRVNAACLEPRPRRAWSKKLMKIRKKWGDASIDIINQALIMKYRMLQP